MNRITSLMMVGLMSLVLGCNSGRSLENHTNQSGTYQEVSYDSLDGSVQRALDGYNTSPDSKYDNLKFHLDSNLASDESIVRLDLTAEYLGDKPLSEEVKLRYIVCGAYQNENGWHATCFARPEYRNLAEPGKTAFQPGEKLHQTIEITPEKKDLSNMKYLVPHVDILVGENPDPKAQSAVYLRK